MTAKSPLYDAHIARNAHMINFHGWVLPLHYGSPIDEHNAVRNSAGMFDVSHMMVVDILGTDSRSFLEKILTNNINKIKSPGHAIYTCMCNDNGGIIDDLIVYQVTAYTYRLVLNAASYEKDLNWLYSQISGFNCSIKKRSELGIIAIQGPEALNKTCSILNSTHSKTIKNLSKFACTEIDNSFFARTGYTGEDGLEIIAPHDKIIALWQKLTEVGVKPCGLASRDTLRVEAGLMLYGQDMDETTTPLETALDYTISLSPIDREFIGKQALLTQKQQGIERKLIGLSLDEKCIMRSQQRVVIPNLNDGIVTSGIYSPTLKKSIAFARVPVAFSSPFVFVEIRNKLYQAKACSTRFLK